jgi:hypothetical protein
MQFIIEFNKNRFYENGILKKFNGKKIIWSAEKGQLRKSEKSKKCKIIIKRL